MADKLLRVAKKMYKPGGALKKAGMHRPEGAGNFDNMDDYNIVKTVNVQTGTIEDTPTDAKHIVNKEYVDSIAVNTGIDLFGYNEASDIGGYLEMKDTIDGTAKETVSDSIPGSTNDYAMGSFATESTYDAFTKINTLTAGVYQMHAHLKAANAGRLKFYAEIYVRAGGGAETLITTTEITDFIGITEEEYNFHAVLVAEVPLVAGDRIVVKAYANNSHPIATDLSIYMEGTTATRVTIRGLTTGSTETDPIWMAQSGNYLTAESDPIWMAQSGNYLTSYTETDPVFMAQSGNYITAEADPIWMAQSGNYLQSYTETDPGWNAQSGNYTKLAYTELISGDLATHTADSSDPHGANLTQTAATITTLSGTNIVNLGDHVTSGTAFTVGVITHTSDTPPTASGFPQGTIYLQYTA